jgi:hypothetical protein
MVQSIEEWVNAKIRKILERGSDLRGELDSKNKKGVIVDTQYFVFNSFGKFVAAREGSTTD